MYAGQIDAGGEFANHTKGKGHETKGGTVPAVRLIVTIEATLPTQMRSSAKGNTLCGLVLFIISVRL
jgi:hypothetical protein